MYDYISVLDLAKVYLTEVFSPETDLLRLLKPLIQAAAVGFIYLSPYMGMRTFLHVTILASSVNIYQLF